MPKTSRAALSSQIDWTAGPKFGQQSFCAPQSKVPYNVQAPHLGAARAMICHNSAII